MFEQKHILWAIHLDFTNFTQENLNKLIPDKNIKILIYCNNNILWDQINFADKSVKLSAESQNEKLTLALNIPTYITLYGYWYHNVYELWELVSIDNPKLIMTWNFIP
jgi:hypothetical protein